MLSIRVLLQALSAVGACLFLSVPALCQGNSSSPFEDPGSQSVLPLPSNVPNPGLWELTVTGALTPDGLPDVIFANAQQTLLFANPGGWSMTNTVSSAGWTDASVANNTTFNPTLPVQPSELLFTCSGTGAEYWVFENGSLQSYLIPGNWTQPKQIAIHAAPDTNGSSFFGAVWDAGESELNTFFGSHNKTTLSVFGQIGTVQLAGSQVHDLAYVPWGIQGSPRVLAASNSGLQVYDLYGNLVQSHNFNCTASSIAVVETSPITRVAVRYENSGVGFLAVIDQLGIEAPTALASAGSDTAIADFNADGLLDCSFGLLGTNLASVLEQGCNGASFATACSFNETETTAAGEHLVAAADFDGDGDGDLLVLDSGNQRVLWRRSSATTSSGLHPIGLEQGTGVTSIVAGEVLIEDSFPPGTAEVEAILFPLALPAHDGDWSDTFLENEIVGYGRSTIANLGTHQNGRLLTIEQNADPRFYAMEIRALGASGNLRGRRLFVLADNDCVDGATLLSALDLSEDDVINPVDCTGGATHVGGFSPITVTPAFRNPSPVPSTPPNWWTNP